MISASAMKPTAKLLLATLALAGCLLPTTSSHWSYSGPDGPEFWPGVCQTGTKQSPIDLGISNVKDGYFESLEVTNYNYISNGTITNNGHSVQIDISNRLPLLLTGGGLSGVYKLKQIHFHWESEHTINGKRFPLEAHFVHYNNKYEYNDAANRERGLAVVAVLFDVSDESSNTYKVFNDVREVISYGKSKTITFNPQDFLPDETLKYYRYYGSLTTPTCDESVIWTVFADPLPILKEQLEIFQGIQTEGGKLLTQNYRPIQLQNRRIVYYQTESNEIPWENGATSLQYSVTVVSTLILIRNIL